MFYIMVLSCILKVADFSQHKHLMRWSTEKIRLANMGRSASTNTIRKIIPSAPAWKITEPSTQAPPLAITHALWLPLQHLARPQLHQNVLSSSKFFHMPCKPDVWYITNKIPKPNFRGLQIFGCRSLGGSLYGDIFLGKNWGCQRPIITSFVEYL